MIVMDELLSSTDVCREAGLTYRILDYWIRCGVIQPHRGATGSGSRREFTAKQCEHLKVMALVRDYLTNFTPDNGPVGIGGISLDLMHSLWLALTEGRPWLLGIRVDEHGQLETGALL